jgi:hypothetical protein
MRLSDSWAKEPPLPDDSGSWDTVTARKAAEAPAVVQAQAQASRIRNIAIGVGLIAAAFVMFNTRKKGAR